jgi:hypothetical protein
MLLAAMKKSLLLVSLLVPLAACAGTTYRGSAGPIFAVTNGEIALQNAGGTLALGDNQNDVDSELGLGDTQAAPYIRLQSDKERHRVRLHGFGFDENGNGTLAGDYGGIAAGSQVTTSTEFFAIAANYGYELLRGENYRFAVGGQAGYYKLDIAARSPVGREAVSTDVLVPMPFVELELLLGPVTIGANAAIMGADIRDASGRYWDMEGNVRWQATKQFDLMAGYRYVLLDAYGTATSRDFDADVDVQGVFITAGIKF